MKHSKLNPRVSLWHQMKEFSASMVNDEYLFPIRIPVILVFKYLSLFANTKNIQQHHHFIVSLGLLN